MWLTMLAADTVEAEFSCIPSMLRTSSHINYNGATVFEVIVAAPAILVWSVPTTIVKTLTSILLFLPISELFLDVVDMWACHEM